MVYYNGTENFSVNTTLQGDSAYKIAVNNGFEGTETEWLESLKGEQGEKGEKGDTGEITQEYAHNTFANILKGNKSGYIIRNMAVSPFEHEMRVKVSGVADLTAVTVQRHGENLLPYPYASTSNTTNGLSYTNNGDGSVTVNGEATSSAPFYITSAVQSKRMLLKAGTYRFSGNPGEFQLLLYAYPDTSTNTADKTVDISKGSVKTFTIDSDKYVLIYISSKTGDAANIIVVRPILERVDVTPTSYPVLADGTVEGITSLYPYTTLTTDTADAVIECEYNRDINKAFEEMTQAIISLGGNI